MIDVGSWVEDCVVITVVELVGGNPFGLRGTAQEGFGQCSV